MPTETDSTTRPAIVVTCDMRSDLRNAGIDATDAELAQAGAEWIAAAIANGARLGYDVTASIATLGSWEAQQQTSTDDGHGGTIEATIWQDAHDDVTVGR